MSEVTVSGTVAPPRLLDEVAELKEIAQSISREAAIECLSVRSESGLKCRMVEYIRAKHPSPEQPSYNDDIPADQLPGCGDTVLLEFNEVPPVAEGDVFREKCPSCKRRESRLEVIAISDDN